MCRIQERIQPERAPRNIQNDKIKETSKDKRRIRKIPCFNPPYSKNVATNIGRKIFQPLQYCASHHKTFLLTYCPSCHKRSWANVRKVPHKCPMAVASASTVRLQVILGRPRFLCPTGFHSTATFGMEPWSLRNIWPIDLQILRAIVVLILPCWHSPRRSWFEIICGQKILIIFRRFLMWKDDNFDRHFSVMLQHSDPYSRV